MKRGSEMPDIVDMLSESARWHEEQGRPYSASVDRDAIAEIRRLRSAAPSDRDVVIEECARVAEEWQQYAEPRTDFDSGLDYAASQIAGAIRHLKTASSTGDAYESEAAKRGDRPLRVRGVGRNAGEPRSISVALTGIPNDDEMRDLHDYLREWSKP